MEDKILKLFKDRPDDFLSGEDISAGLKISRSALWKHIEKLREFGYDFDAVPHLGYRLKSIPDRLYPFEVRQGLNTKIMGQDVTYYDTIDSTNKAAYGIAQAGAREGSIVIAEKQTKGRGRLSREWVSPANKGIYVSIILRPRITPFEAPSVTLMAAVSVCCAIREYTGAKALIKWPNDILINEKKAAGILTEMEAEQDSVKFIILGIGINVNAKTPELPKGAGSISEEMSNDISRAGLLRALLEQLEQHYNILKNEGFAPIRKEWIDFSATLGRRVRAVCMARKIEGEAIGIDPDGALRVRLDNGFQERVTAGQLGILKIVNVILRSPEQSRGATKDLKRDSSVAAAPSE